MSGPAPSRIASRCVRRLRSTRFSTLSSGRNGDAETRPPAARRAVLVVQEDVGLQRRKAALPRLGADLPDAVEIGDRRLEEARVVDPPGRAMRPVDPDPVADLAAEQRVARHAERLRLGVEQRVLDRAEPLGDDPAGGRPGQAVELGVDALVVEHRLADDARRQPLDHRGDARRAETLVELAPADDAAVGRQLQEIVVAPAGVAAQHLEPGHLHDRISCLA